MFAHLLKLVAVRATSLELRRSSSVQTPDHCATATETATSDNFLELRSPLLCEASLASVASSRGYRIQRPGSEAAMRVFVVAVVVIVT